MKKLLLFLVILNLALVAAPAVPVMYLMRHTPAMIRLAYVAKMVGPAVTAISCLIAAAFVYRWRWSLVPLALFIGCAVLVRMNYVEQMFAPVFDAEMAEIGSFHDIQDTDMVIGVTIGGESRAYPVRYLAYHHMLNDRIGATALLPNY